VTEPYSCMCVCISFHLITVCLILVLVSISQAAGRPSILPRSLGNGCDRSDDTSSRYTCTQYFAASLAMRGPTTRVYVSVP